MHKKRIIWLIDLIICAGLYICCENWIPLYLCAVVLFLPLLSLLCSLPFVSRKKVRESHADRMAMGKSGEVSFRIGGSSGNPLPCSVDVCVKDLMDGTSRSETLVLYCGDSQPLKLDTSHCGRYVISVARAVFSDFLGFFSFRARCPESFFVSVDPAAARPDPMPDFSHFVPLRYYPRRGGGFSEIHELREYAPGDPVSAIHWKLSAKTDDLIIREPQDREQSRVYLTLDRVPDRDEMDLTLGCLVWVSEKLFSLDVSFHVCCILDNVRGSVTETSINDRQDLTALLDKIMGGRPFDAADSLVKYRIPDATWRFHVNPRKEDADAR